MKHQKKEDARKSRDGKAQKGLQQPLTAPQPTRVSTAGNMWKADAGIQFGANEADNEKEDQGTKAAKAKATNWDPNKPIRFG